MGRKTEDGEIPKKHVTRELIKQEFIRMYVEKGLPLNRIKVSHFVDNCNISRGTFYFYFNDVYRLYDECQADVIRMLEEGIQEINMSTLRGHYKKHAKVYSKYLEKYVTNKALLKGFMYGSERVKFRDVFYDSILKNYSHVMAFTMEMDENIRELLIHFYAGGLANVLAEWVYGGCKESTEIIGEMVSRVLYKGNYFWEGETR